MLKYIERPMRRGQWARVVALLAAMVMLLAGCVMPDGTVYTLPQAALPVAAETHAEASPADAHIAQARENGAEGDLAAALDELNQAIAADPDAAEAYYLRALTYAQLGDFDAAFDDLDRALALTPDDVDSLILRAQLFWELGDVAASAADYDRALTLSNGGEGLDSATREEAYYVIAVDHYIKGDLSAVAANLAEILRINPWNGDLYSEYAHFAQSAAHYEGLVAEYDAIAAAAASPGSAAYAEGMKHLLRARLFQIPEEYSAAIVALTEAIEDDPDMAAAYHARGVARILSAAYAQGSSAHYSGGDGEVTYTDPTTGEEVTTSQEAYDAMMAEADEAVLTARTEGIDDLNRALALDPARVEALYDLGVAYFARQEQPFAGFVYTRPDEEGRDQALQLFDQAIAAAPEWDQARLGRMLASLHWATQDYYDYEAAANVDVLALHFANDGMTITSIHDDLSYAVWDTQLGELLASRPGLEQDDDFFQFVSAAISPDGTRFVTADTDQIVRLWDLQSGEELMTLAGHEFGLEQVIFNADGTHIVSAGNDMVRVWDGTTGEPLLDIDAKAPIALSPDGLQLVAADDAPDLAVWDLQTGTKQMTLTGPVGPDEDWSSVYLYVVDSIAFSPDGQSIAAYSGQEAIRIWVLADDDTAHVLHEPFDGQSYRRGHRWMAYSPNGATMVASRVDGTLSLWDVASGEEIANFGSDEDVAIFSPDGTMIASTSPDGTVTLHDAQSATVRMSLKREDSATVSALQANAARLFETAAEDAEILIAREVGEGWPYYVRFSVLQFTTDEMDEDTEAQFEADFATFRQLSPNANLDDLWVEAAAAVRFSSPVPSTAPLMVSHIEGEIVGEQTLVHPEAGFTLDIPIEEARQHIVEVSVPDGPIQITMSSDFRIYQLLVYEADLGDLSMEAWLTAELGRIGIEEIEFLDPYETDYGEATILAMPDFQMAALPIDQRVFIFSQAQSEMGSGWIGDDSVSRPEVLTDFVAGLTLLEE